jgi:hypothetical protein
VLTPGISCQCRWFHVGCAVVEPGLPSGTGADTERTLAFLPSRCFLSEDEKDKILSRDRVTVDGFWIDNRIY